ncbi:MAG: ATP-binding protein [Candidatus Margulisbacteria bacterium]|nr:ATP-binding protein [Candidatus Margulisiibacteriota bacterium]
MKIAIASGKGGTGKTLISTNLFNVTPNSTYIDCDVEEPNGHLFLKGTHVKEQSFHIMIPEVNQNICNNCGKCAEVCQFNAIISAKQKVLVFPELCHGCGSCTFFCPTKAITETPKIIGKIQETLINNKPMITGTLNIGEPMAPPIIKQLKALPISTEHIIIDSPPGTSCPVIAAITGADMVLLVTEPTPFGLHDLDLAVQVVQKLNIPMGIIVNKSGLGGNIIENYSKKKNIEILLEIPHSKTIAKLYSEGKLITTLPKYKKIFENLSEKIQKKVKGFQNHES